MNLPLWTISPRWLMTSRSSMTTPPSRIERLVAVRERLKMVSPTRTGSIACHSKPMKASTASGGCGTRQPRPVVRQSGRISGTAPASRGSSWLSPA